MPVAAVAVALILGSLGLLALVSLALLRMGMIDSRLTDAARERLAGCGMILLILTILGLGLAAFAGFVGLNKL